MEGDWAAMVCGCELPAPIGAIKIASFFRVAGRRVRRYETMLDATAFPRAKSWNSYRWAKANLVHGYASPSAGGQALSTYEGLSWHKHLVHTSFDMKSSHATLEIRPAVRDDAIEILRVRREAILSKAASHYGQAILDDWVDAVDAADRAARIGRNISDPGFVVLVAEVGSEVIGFASAALATNELQALYVRPNQIGKVGQALLAALESIAFETVPFLVCDASLNAEGFYKANGYSEECRKDHVSRPGGVISRVVQMKKHRPNVQPE